MTIENLVHTIIGPLPAAVLVLSQSIDETETYKKTTTTYHYAGECVRQDARIELKIGCPMASILGSLT